MTTIPCPFCNSPIPFNASICVRCGKRGGERLERVKNAVLEEQAKAREEVERQKREHELRRKTDDAKRAARNRSLTNSKEKLQVFAKTRRGIATIVALIVIGLSIGTSLTFLSLNPVVAALFCGGATLTDSGIKVSQNLEGDLMVGMLGVYRGEAIPDSESVACVWKTLGFGPGTYYVMKSGGVPNRERHGEYLVGVSRDRVEVTWKFDQINSRYR